MIALPSPMWDVKKRRVTVTTILGGQSARAEFVGAVPIEVKYDGTVKYAGLLSPLGFRMDGLGPEEIASTAPVSITVLSVTPMRAGRLFALASVELDIDGVSMEIHGIRATHVSPGATRIELPTYRDAAGRPRTAIVLPEEVRGPIGDAVLDRLVELGLAVRRSRAIFDPKGDYLGSVRLG